MAAAAFAVWTVRPRPDPLVRANVRVTSGGFLLSRDERGTDVTGFIENLNPVTVDVTVRARGYDIAGRPVAEATLGPITCAPDGQPYPISVYLDCTPLDSVTLDATSVSRVDTPPRVRAAGRFAR
jgi:hypothetical protein